MPWCSRCRTASTSRPVEAFAAAGYDILCEKPLAGTEAACAAVVGAAERAGVFLGVCHVLRYTPTTERIIDLLDAGAVGDVVAVHHLEPVGFYHFAHSFVRGAWRREDESGPMLLTKACHDLDWLSHRRRPAGSSRGVVRVADGVRRRPPSARRRRSLRLVRRRTDVPVLGAAALPRRAAPGRGGGVLHADRRPRLHGRGRRRRAARRAVRALRVRQRQRRLRPPGGERGVRGWRDRVVHGDARSPRWSTGARRSPVRPASSPPTAPRSSTTTS